MAGAGLRLAFFTARAPWGRTEPFVLTEIASIRPHVEQVLIVPVRRDGELFHGVLARELAGSSVQLPLVSASILAVAISTAAQRPAEVTSLLLDLLRDGRSRVRLKNFVVFPKALYIAQSLQAFRPHHIHACWASVPATMAFIVSRVLGVPWSFTAHSWDIGEDNILSAKVRAASFVRVISEFGKNRLLRLVDGSYDERLHVIHVGTRTATKPAKATHRPRQPLVVGCIARLDDVKGHRHLIAACRILRDQGIHFVCELIGDGPLRQELKAAVHEAGLAQNVHFQGARTHSDVLAILERGELDVVVLPSVEASDGRVEGIPVALLEAMAHGIPTIASDIGGIPELLTGGAGILVRPGDPIALAAAIERMAADPTVRETAVRNGLVRVRSEFDLNRIADDLVRLMDASSRR
jgi:glycosyltransferase involved in cell wall biosynthesis